MINASALAHCGPGFLRAVYSFTLEADERKIRERVASNNLGASLRPRPCHRDGSPARARRAQRALGREGGSARRRPNASRRDVGAVVVVRPRVAKLAACKTLASAITENALRLAIRAPRRIRVSDSRLSVAPFSARSRGACAGQRHPSRARGGRAVRPEALVLFFG